MAPTCAMLVGSIMIPEPIMFTATMKVSCIRFICVFWAFFLHGIVLSLLVLVAGRPCAIFHSRTT